ncbi:hypothetical protein METHB2_470030 [Candidatus Methylobacter favarea]|uniref:Uncharacterized protein n=2 Tax=Candidatus Methylobacter favarea TaxID=2707345 RepID=A0A8S0XTJ9_9GAMM|nr:hypothetical protein METHB2_470030 [Candidatus Methylobacter favarea]
MPVHWAIMSTLTAELAAQIEQMAALHEQNVAAQYAGVFKFSALDINYKNAEKELLGNNSFQ